VGLPKTVRGRKPSVIGELQFEPRVIDASLRDRLADEVERWPHTLPVFGVRSDLLALTLRREAEGTSEVDTEAVLVVDRDVQLNGRERDIALRHLPSDR
jgi:hypothetical protein